MFALYLAVILTASEPPLQTFELTSTQPSIRSVATDNSVTTVPDQAVMLNRLFVQPPPKASIDLSRYTDLVPYGTELVQLNDLYQRYRADKRWNNGIGLTFALGHQRHRWTFALGPIQFTFGGQKKLLIR